MLSREETLQEIDRLKKEYGEWTYDMPLPDGIWTRGNLGIPHTRLRRILQIISDLSDKPLAESRVLDLGCLEGLFSMELAKHGATTVGVEIREANINKAIFCAEALELDNVEFRQDDVRNVTLESYGRFDVVICSGILYHLQAQEAIELLNNLYEIANRAIVIDTAISVIGADKFVRDGVEYHGSVYREHSDTATPEAKAKHLLASADNPTSFWFSRPSLINILTRAGFSSVYECFTPAHLNFGAPGIESKDRCTFVAIKNDPCDVVMSPSVNKLQEFWPENSLAYSASDASRLIKPRPLHRRLFRRLRGKRA